MEDQQVMTFTGDVPTGVIDESGVVASNGSTSPTTVDQLSGLFTRMVSAPTAETESSPRVESLKNNDGGTLSGGNPIIDVAQAMLAAAGQKVVSIARATPTGKAVEAEATRQKITELLTSPVAILIMIVALLLLGAGLSKVAR